MEKVGQTDKTRESVAGGSLDGESRHGMQTAIGKNFFGHVHHSHGTLGSYSRKSRWGGKAVWAAQKETDYLYEILAKYDDKNYRIQPVVIYPGWYVKDDCSRKVWVLNDQYFIKKVLSLPSTLSAEEIQVIRGRIEDYAREKTAKLDYKGNI